MNRAITAAVCTTLAVAFSAAPAAAQTLTEIGTTQGISDTLAGTGYPTIEKPPICAPTSLPDLDEEGKVIPRETTCTPGTPAAAAPGTDSKAQSNGRYCRAESRKRVRGQKGTPFSRCASAMAKLRSGAATTPAAACKGLSRRRVRGQSGSAYGRCVSAGRRLRADTAA